MGSGGQDIKLPISDMDNCDYTFEVNGGETYFDLIYTFNYTGSSNSSFILEKGQYIIDLYGASGQDGGESGGAGYSKRDKAGIGGNFHFTFNNQSKQQVFICIGGSSDGFNGGGVGASYYSSSSDWRRWCGNGGGATHIGLKSGLLTEYEFDYQDKLIAVAGGGAGGGVFTNNKGNHGTAGKGGGYSGQTGGNVQFYDKISSVTATGAAGGTQTTGYAFGKGQDIIDKSWFFIYSEAGAAGSGFYGGFAAHYKTGSKGETYGAGGSGGGSGFINDEYCIGAVEGTGITGNGKIIIKQRYNIQQPE